MSTTYTITIGLPHPSLSPNGSRGMSRGASMGRASRKKKQRKAAYYSALAALNGAEPPMWKRAVAEVTYFVRDRRGLARDKDNCDASIKAAYDGIADAGIVENDRGLDPRIQPVQIDRDNPRVEIAVSKEPDHA